MAAQAATLRMRDVCARTGLARSTIHHYIREGLLPPPTKTGRNTALYDEDFVKRVKLVKALQERTHLPLAVIRETLNGLPDGAVGTVDVERFAAVTHTIADTLRLSSEAPVPRTELLARSGLSPGELKGMEIVGLVESATHKGQRMYSALDARIVMAFASLRAAGLPVDEGYLDVVTAYRKHLAAVARAEAKHMVRMMRTLAAADLDELIGRTAEQVGDLIAALHQKALVNEIARMTDTEG